MTQAVLLRDEHGDPITRLVERDRYGRWTRPRHDFIWVTPDVAAARARGLAAMTPGQHAAYAAAGN